MPYDFQVILDHAVAQDTAFLEWEDEDAILGELCLRVLQEVRARGLDAGMERQAIVETLRWWFGPTALRWFKTFAPVLEALAEAAPPSCAHPQPTQPER